MSAQRRREWFWAAVFLAPAIGILIFVRVSPTVSAVASSLFVAFPGGLRGSDFAGFFNYEAMFSDPDFLAVFWRTLAFNLVINPVQVFLALLLAILFTQKVRLTGLWRTLIFIPVTIPGVGSVVVWGAIFQPDGPLNSIISTLGGEPQPFFTSKEQALACIMVLVSWTALGVLMMFVIAGLQAIPTEYYEAAKIDRAGPIRTFFSITLPLLKRPLLFVLVADTIGNFIIYGPMQIYTKGGPEGSTTMLMYNAAQTTYAFGNHNSGAAQVTVLTAIMLVFVVLQFRLLREEDDAR